MGRIKIVQRYIIIMVSVLIPLLVFAGCGQNYSAEKQLWYANKLRKEKLKKPEAAVAADYAEVIASYKKILREYPDWKRNGEVRIIIARLYLAKKDFTRAEEEFKKVLETYPQDTVISIKAQVGIGTIYERQGEWKRAESEYKRIVANVPHVSSSGRLLVATFEIPLYIARHYQVRRQGQEAKDAYQEAIAGYRKVEEKNKKNELGAVAQVYIARAYMNQGKWEESIKAFQALIAAHPQSPRVPATLYRIGQIYQEQLKLPTRAIENYRKYIEDYPKGAKAKEARFLIAQTYAQQGDSSQAIKEYQLVLNRYPKDNKLSPSAQLAIGSLYEQEGKWDQALGEYGKVKRDFPGTLPALRVPLHIASYYQEKKKTGEAKKAYGEARAYYEKLAAGNKDTSFGLVATEFLANTYFARKDWEGGIKVLETIPAEYPHVPRAAAVFYRIGQIYQKQLKLPTRAIESYRKYIETYPGEANVKGTYFRIAQLYARQKDFSQAIKECQFLLNKYPKDNKLSPSAQLAIGAFYEEEGKWDRALPEYRKVLSDFPGTFSALQVPLQIARYYQTQKKTGEAKKAYGEARAYYEKLAAGKRNTPLGLAAAEFLANTYFSQKKWDEGIKALQKLVAVYPKTPRAVAAMFHIAEIYQVNLNRGEQAIRTYEGILKQYPQPDIAAQALFQIGLVYQHVLKQPGQAKAIYRKFLTDYPKHKLADKVRKALQSLQRSAVHSP